MKKIFSIISVVLELCLAMSAKAQEQNVKVWEEPLTLPTYLLNPAETAPIFTCDWSYQRARRSIYPYPLNDNTTGVKSEKTYNALYLENEYIKVCVIPELGGRLFYAIDKTNGYDIFYHQDVIKPAKIGMAGAWISGVAEWNFFHHHRVTSFTPCDYKIMENADGSKTIWLGETEWRHRMQWAIGITVHPHKSYIEISGRMMNSTENDNSMLYWSNVATHTNENYQIIFPQSTEFVTFHCKDSFAHWPITHEPYCGCDEYINNIDASWWSRHPVAGSMFVHNLPDDFIAGYDHGRHAGTMLCGNRHIVNGGKFWSWGPNSEWDSKKLSDTAGHYLELMHGAYSDNQPDYNWTAPYEVKSFTQYWYGIRDIKGVKKGNERLALNMELSGKGKVLLGVNATEKLSDLTINVLKDNDVLYTQKINVAPDAPWLNTIAVDKAVVEHELTMNIIDAKGKTLLSYTPVIIDTSKPLPPIVDTPKYPDEIENNEECFLVGMRSLQFNNPFIRPEDYFEEVLSRDPYDIRSNTQMGISCRLRGDNENAKTYLRRAIARQTRDYTRPYDCEAMYNLGLILKVEGNLEAATDTLYRAVWNYNYNSAANTQLAQIYMAQDNQVMALDRLDEAITYNGNNTVALNLKTSILRTLGDRDGAEHALAQVLKVAPVNRYATHEKALLTGDEREFRALMRDDAEAYLELALNYYANSYSDTAVNLLKYIDSKTAYPTVKMWLGYLMEKSGQAEEAKQLYADALALPVDYCNPFRLETIGLFEHLTSLYPDNANLRYYLGNVLYDKQPLRAIEEWTKCVELEPYYAMAWRNLGWAEWKHTKNYTKAIENYRKAIACKPQTIFVDEISRVFEAANVDMKERYELAASTHDINYRRFEALCFEIKVSLFEGKYDNALKLLREGFFADPEGSDIDVHSLYTDALLLKGTQKMKSREFEEAIALYEEAFVYPDNQQVYNIDNSGPCDAKIYWYIADAYEKDGNKAKSNLFYKKAAAVNTGKSDYSYWHALALQKLGKKEEADAIFSALKTRGEESILEEEVFNFQGGVGAAGMTKEAFNTQAYHTLGLGYLGLGNKAKAAECFRKSLECKKSNLWSYVMLNEIQ